MRNDDPKIIEIYPPSSLDELARQRYAILREVALIKRKRKEENLSKHAVKWEYELRVVLCLENHNDRSVKEDKELLTKLGGIRTEADAGMRAAMVIYEMLMSLPLGLEFRPVAKTGETTAEREMRYQRNLAQYLARVKEVGTDKAMAERAMDS